jgi:dGTPase
LERPRIIHETVRRVISGMVAEVVAQTKKNCADASVKSSDDVRSQKRAMVQFGAQMAENNRVLQAFLSTRMYRHERVLEIMDRAQRVIRDLFEAYMNDASLMPEDWRDHGPATDRGHYARQVCDFLSGMTDRFALDQHKRLFDLDPLFR